MDSPLTTGSYDSNSVQRLFGGSSRERRGEPFDGMARLDQSSGDFKGKGLGSTGPWVAWAAPVEN
jgi:hypothetical protein